MCSPQTPPPLPPIQNNAGKGPIQKRALSLSLSNAIAKYSDGLPNVYATQGRFGTIELQPQGDLPRDSTPHAHFLAAFQGPDLARASDAALPPHALPHFLQAEFLHPELHDRQARVVLVLVVRADPVPRHQVLRDLDAARDAGVDVAAHVPGVFDAVEAVDEGGERKGGVRDEVVRGVRDQVRGVRDTVGGVEEGESFGRPGLVVI